MKPFRSSFQKDSSGRIKAKPFGPLSELTLHIPSAKPGVSIPVVTKNREERVLLGRWMAALSAAGRNDFSRMEAFPRGTVIGGVPLTTDPEEVQDIVVAIAEEEEPYEGLYRVIARPS